MTDQQSPEQDQPIGQRTLAAIMFTDVADFSRLMGEDEERTMRSVKRDLRLISNLCTEAKGRVLKFMGDGILAIFTSGVHAVECAQEIQQQLTEQARGLSRDEVLHHRIGMHLGDVFIHEDEVMGDGVNIAARLQTEAPPGGICISQALYGVVKRRMALQTVHQGAKQLKNISEEVHIYQIIVDDGSGSIPTRSSAQGTLPKYKTLLWIAAVIIILGGSAVLYMVGKNAGLNTISDITGDSPAGNIGDSAGIDSNAVFTPPIDKITPKEQSGELVEDNGISDTEGETIPPPTSPPDTEPSKGSDRLEEEEVQEETEAVDPLVPHATSVFRQLDKDENRRITPDEMPTRTRRELMRADKNKDGSVDVDEFISAFRFLRDLKQRIRPTPQRGAK